MVTHHDLNASQYNLKRQPEVQEDYEFLQKLGTEFGNSSSHPNFFGGGFLDGNSGYDREIYKAGSSSFSYSHEFDGEESVMNPNLLSILHSKDQY